MEHTGKSMLETERAIRVGLINAGFRSIRDWARRRSVNYNTAYAALKGRRRSPLSLRLVRRMRRDANV